MENVYLTSKESMANEPEENRQVRQNETPKSRETLAKFHQIIRHYLQEEIDHPSDLIQSILGSYSLAAYLEHTVVTGRDDVIANLLSQCSSAFQGTFQSSNSTCFVHEEPATGIIHLLQMRLLHLYPKFSTQGYEALYSCPPTIYISPLCIPSLGNMICRKLGFPSSCVKVLRMTDEELPKLEKSLQEDLAAKRIPVMLIASIGSHHNGAVDNLLALSALAQRFNMWLHLEGHLISKLSLLDHHKEAQLIADSLHLDLRLWLGIPSLPFVTLYRQCETALQRAACLTPASCSTFTVVPLWFTVQMYESSQIKERFRTALELSETLAKHLATISNIQIMSFAPKSALTEDEGLKDASTEAAEEAKPGADPEISDTAVEAEQDPEPTSETDVSSVEAKESDEVVDQESKEIEESKVEEKAEDEEDGEKSAEMEENNEKNESSDSSLAVKTADEKEDESESLAKDDATEASDLDPETGNEAQPVDEPPCDAKSRPQALMEAVCPVVVFQYQPKTKDEEPFPTNVVDDLNLWLAQVLERTCDVVHIDVIDVDQSGYALRFSPYDSLIFPTMDNMGHFLSCFDQQIEILNATVEHKSTLFQIVEASPELQLVELPGWAGLGGVRYLPAAWRSNLVEQLPDQGKEEINKINRQLVSNLKLTDSAFSLGEGRDGLVCVRFGMVVADTDVPALASLVRQTGLDIESSSQELETMAVLVRKGIEEAQAELQKETEQQLWEEGLIRHIPVVGSLVNYFLPTQKTVRIHGYVLSPDSKQSHNGKLELPLTRPSSTSRNKDSEAMPIVFTVKHVEMPKKLPEESRAKSSPEDRTTESSEGAVVGVPTEVENAIEGSAVPEAEISKNVGQVRPESCSQSGDLKTNNSEQETAIVTSADQGQEIGSAEAPSLEEEKASVEESEPGAGFGAFEVVQLSSNLEHGLENNAAESVPEVILTEQDAEERNEAVEESADNETREQAIEVETAAAESFHAQKSSSLLESEDSSHSCEAQATTSIQSNELSPVPETATQSDETGEPSDSLQVTTIENEQVAEPEQLVESANEVVFDGSTVNDEVSEDPGSQGTNELIVELDEPKRETSNIFKVQTSSVESSFEQVNDPVKEEASLPEIQGKGNEEPTQVEELHEEVRAPELQTATNLPGYIPDTSCIEESLSKSQDVTRSIVEEIRKMDERLQTQIELQLNLTALVKQALSGPAGDESCTEEPKGKNSIVEEIEKIDERLQKQIELQLNLTALVKKAVVELKSHQSEETMCEVVEVTRQVNAEATAAEPAGATEDHFHVPGGEIVTFENSDSEAVALATEPKVEESFGREVGTSSSEAHSVTLGDTVGSKLTGESLEPTKLSEECRECDPNEAEPEVTAEESDGQELEEPKENVPDTLINGMVGCSTQEEKNDVPGLINSNSSILTTLQPLENASTEEMTDISAVVESREKHEPLDSTEVNGSSNVVELEQATGAVPQEPNINTENEVSSFDVNVEAGEADSKSEEVVEDSTEVSITTESECRAVPEDRNVSNEPVEEPAEGARAAEELATPESVSEAAEGATETINASGEGAIPESIPEVQSPSQPAPEEVEVPTDSQTSPETVDDLQESLKAVDESATPESIPELQSHLQAARDVAEVSTDCVKSPEELPILDSMPDVQNSSQSSPESFAVSTASLQADEESATSEFIKDAVESSTEAVEAPEPVPESIPVESKDTALQSDTLADREHGITNDEHVIDADLSDLAQMVKSSDAETETPVVDLNDMAQLVQKGIQEAQAELQRQIEDHVWQEGLVRHLPVVGSLYNFFSPAPKADIKGRTLDLQKGRVEKSDVAVSTEGSSNAQSPSL